MILGGTQYPAWNSELLLGILFGSPPNLLPNPDLGKVVLMQKEYYVYLRLTLLVVLLCSGLTHAQLEGPSFTAQQASAGKNTYDIHCAVCHGPNLTDGEF